LKRPVANEVNRSVLREGGKISVRGKKLWGKGDGERDSVTGHSPTEDVGGSAEKGEKKSLMLKKEFLQEGERYEAG